MPSQPAESPALAKLKPLPDLPPVTRASYVIAPVEVALSAIRAQPRCRRAAHAGRQERQSGEQHPVEGRYRHDRHPRQSRHQRQAGRSRRHRADQFHHDDHRADRRASPATSPAASPASSTTPLGQAVGGLTNRVLDQRADVQRHGHRAFAPRHHRELAARAQSQRAARARQQRGAARRHQAQHGERGAPAARADGQPAGVRAGEPPAQRSLHRAGRARAMGQDVPRHPARRRQDRPAETVAGDAPGARRRRPAQDRRACA